jgi:hypothetical protein
MILFISESPIFCSLKSYKKLILQLVNQRKYEQGIRVFQDTAG